MAVSTEEGEVELEISDDPHDCTRLDVSSIPLTVTMSKVEFFPVVIIMVKTVIRLLIISLQEIVHNSFEW